MSVTVEINELSNNSSKLGIYINDRPIYWTGRAIEKPAIDKNPHHFMRYITGDCKIFCVRMNNSLKH